MSLTRPFTEEAVIKTIYEQIGEFIKPEYVQVVSDNVVISFISVHDKTISQYVLSNTLQFVSCTNEPSQSFAEIINKYCSNTSSMILLNCFTTLLFDNKIKCCVVDGGVILFDNNIQCMITSDYQWIISNPFGKVFDVVPFFEFIIDQKFLEYPKKNKVIVSTKTPIYDFILDLNDADPEMGTHVKTFTDTNQIKRDHTVSVLLYHATVLKDDKIIQLLKSNDVTIDSDYAMQQVIQTHNLDMLALLITENTSPNHEMLLSCLKQQWLDGFKLIMNTTPVDVTSKKSAWLHYCGEYDTNAEITSFLINQKNANMNARNYTDESKDTPLMTAITYDNMKVFNILLQFGADINMQNKDGASALGRAVRYDRTQMIDKLLLSGIDVNLQNSDGDTVLHTTVVDYPNHLVEKILAFGANIYLKNISNETVFDTANEKCHEMLKEYQIKQIPKRVNTLTNIFNQKTKLVDKSGSLYEPFDTKIATAVYKISVDANPPVSSVLYIPKCTCDYRTYNASCKKWVLRSIKMDNLQVEITDQHCINYHMMEGQMVRFIEFDLSDGTRHHFVPYV